MRGQCPKGGTPRRSSSWMPDGSHADKGRDHSNKAYDCGEGHIGDSRPRENGGGMSNVRKYLPEG